jgi:Grx4 family monothiol glutaredoxin
MSSPPSDLANLHAVTSPEHFQSLLSEDLRRVSLINFWAPWAAPCTQMNLVVKELAKKYPKVLVLDVEAEQQPDIAESFEIQSVPAFIILCGHTLLDRVSGADAAALTSALEKHAKTPPQALSKTSEVPASAPNYTPAEEKDVLSEDLRERLIGLMKQSDVVLFMKGTPETPRCGFSRKIVDFLNEKKVRFTTFDILTDESVRQGMKKLNEWPTFPQLIVEGELVGGLDIVKEMDQAEFADTFGRSTIQ